MKAQHVSVGYASPISLEFRRDDTLPVGRYSRVATQVIDSSIPRLPRSPPPSPETTTPGPETDLSQQFTSLPYLPFLRRACYAELEPPLMSSPNVSSARPAAPPNVTVFEPPPIQRSHSKPFRIMDILALFKNCVGTHKSPPVGHHPGTDPAFTTPILEPACLIQSDFCGPALPTPMPTA